MDVVLINRNKILKYINKRFVDTLKVAVAINNPEN